MSEKLSPEQWEGVESKLGQTELVERKRRLAAREQKYEENPEILAKIEHEAEILANEIAGMLGNEDSPEHALKALQWDNLKKAIAEYRTNEHKQQQLLKQESELLESINKAQEKNLPVSGKRSALITIRKDLVKTEENQAKLRTSNPEAFYGLHILELKELKNQARGKIVETPYVKRQAEEIFTHMQTGQPVLIYGHFGTGKSELAIHVAQKYLGKEPEIVSGRKDIAPDEIYGHQKLSVDKETKATISEFYMGPIYRAMKEGRPLIIDEVNAIPHEVLISLNHILTRRIGEEVNIQMDSGERVTIQEGFCIIMTGNLNQGQEQYIAREDMDPAFLSRIHQVEYDYLPQKTEGSFGDEAGVENELFGLIIARTMDRNANIELPEGSVRKLWNLAKAARITQDVFAGREVSNAFYFQQGGSAVKYLLQKSVLTMRALNKIMTQWQKEQYKYELDYYIYKEFISQSTIASDRAYLYQLFKDRFGFFQTKKKVKTKDDEVEENTWEQTPNYGTGGIITSFDISVPENPAGTMEFFGPRQTVEFVYGKPPDRTNWPDVDISKSAAKETANTKFLERIQAALESQEEEERQNVLVAQEIEEASRSAANPSESQPTGRLLFKRKKKAKGSN